jgi:hypothetical protein
MIATSTGTVQFLRTYYVVPDDISRQRISSFFVSSKSIILALFERCTDYVVNPPSYNDTALHLEINIVIRNDVIHNLF